MSEKEDRNVDASESEASEPSSTTPPRKRRIHWSIWVFGLVVLPTFIGRLIYDQVIFSEFDPNGRHRSNFNIKIYEKGDKTLLYGGEDDAMHFDITECRLNPKRLEYGLGREAFPALLEPEFEDGEDVFFGDFEKVIVVKIGDDVRVYPRRRLGDYEVVNDVVGGKPIMVGYCVLADLGAVYEREIGERTYTFGVSGYTYWEPKVWDYLSAFVLWDRETESLWWPPIGKAVSGPSIDIPMKVLDEKYWAQTTWEDVVNTYPEFKVLKKGQNFDRPESWPGAEPPSNVDRARWRTPESAIAPKWGENHSLPK